MSIIENLTKKQSDFLNYILQGKTQLEAYKLAFDTKAKDSSIKVKASNLFKSKKVQDEYKRAIMLLQEKAVYSKEKAIDDLIFLVDKCKADIDEKGVKQANVLGLTKAIEQITNILCLSDIENKKFKLEQDRLEFAKSKVQKDNDNLQKENASLLRSLVNGRINN